MAPSGSFGTIPNIIRRTLGQLHPEFAGSEALEYVDGAALVGLGSR